jgi:hypothetical protein
MTILGGDIVETYYLSQLYADDIFERVLLNHYSSRNLSREVLADLLLTAECDLLISSEPLNIPELIISLSTASGALFAFSPATIS